MHNITHRFLKLVNIMSELFEFEAWKLFEFEAYLRLQFYLTSKKHIYHFFYNNPVR